jgi:hypothetical protein
MSPINVSCPEVWPGLECGSHGMCETITGVCVCNISGWAGTAEFSVLGWDRLVCDYNIPFARGLAVMGVLVNLAALLVLCYVTSDRSEFNHSRQTFFGCACGMALSLQRLAVPFPNPLMGTNPVHTALMATYASCLIGTMLTFLRRFAVAIHASSMSALAPPKAELPLLASASPQFKLSLPGLLIVTQHVTRAQFKRSLPGMLIVTQQVTHVLAHSSTVCSLFYGVDERVWAAGYYCLCATAVASCSFTAFVDIYMTGRMIRDLEQFLRVEEELHHEADEAVTLRRRNRIARNIKKLRFLRNYVGAALVFFALCACSCFLSLQVLYAMKYLCPGLLHVFTLVVSATTLLLYFGGRRQARRSNKVLSSRNRVM